MNYIPNILERYLAEVTGGTCTGCAGGCGSSGGCGLGPPIRRGGTGVCTDYQDVDDLQSDGGYQTQFQPGCVPDRIYSGFKAMENKNITEQGEDPVETPIENPETEKPEVPETEETPPAGGEGFGIPGTPEEEEVPQDPEYIGRVYELKKIYARLVSVESFLNDASDIKLLKLRNYVSSATELFQTLINNIEAYKDNIDNLIVLFYKFLLVVYSLLSQFYEKENKKKNKK